MKFKIENSGLLHGFAGFFDSKLYGDVHISTKTSWTSLTAF